MDRVVRSVLRALLALPLISLLNILPARASDIAWGPPQQITGDADVSTNGTLDRAYLFAGAPGPPATVNGVTFHEFVQQNTDTSTFQTSVNGALGSANPPYSNTSIAYRSLLSNATYNFNAAPATLTLNTLTPGAEYEVQIWVNDSRASTRTETVSGAPTLDYNTTNTHGGLGQYILGRFVADSTGSQPLTFTPGASSVVQLNALQLRRLAPVAFLTGSVLIATDAEGNSTTQYWATGTGFFLFLKKESIFQNFLNGQVRIPLSPGTHTFDLVGDGSGIPNLPHYGLNLFFDEDNVNPAISAFAPLGISEDPTPPFLPNSAPNSSNFTGIVPAAGTLLYTKGNIQITLADYYWQAPSVQNTNQVGQFNIIPGGGGDYTGRITLLVEELPSVPVIQSLTPGAAALGGPTFTLTVEGSGFRPHSVVQWNGSNRPTSYISATQLTAEISASDISKPGSAQVRVINPDAKASNAVTIPILSPIIRVSSTLARDPETNEVLVTLTLTNVGGGYAHNVRLIGATLAAVAPTAPGFPLSLGTLAPTESISALLRFPANIASGSAILRTKGGYGSGSFGSGNTVTVP